MGPVEYEFIDTKDPKILELTRGPYWNFYFYINIQLSADTTTTSRSVYNLFDLFGDFGGLSEVVLLLSGLLMAPIAEHFFVIKALQKLYLANTVTENLF